MKKTVYSILEIKDYCNKKSDPRYIPHLDTLLYPFTVLIVPPI